jgi:hypothetical protein
LYQSARAISYLITIPRETWVENILTNASFAKNRTIDIRGKGWTVRDILGGLGAMMGGNWDINGFHPMGFASYTVDTSTGAVASRSRGGRATFNADDIGTLTRAATVGKVSHVTLVGQDADGNDVEYTAGTNGGLHVEARCPWANASDPAFTLSVINAYDYEAWSATGLNTEAIWNTNTHKIMGPLGSGFYYVDTKGVEQYGYVAKYHATSGERSLTWELSAPSDEELIHE